jgi:uncharacterized protein with NRDE domain
MCTLLVGVERPRPGTLMLGANRDESLTRPAVSPHVLSREPKIVAGRDTLAGGTWLGVQVGTLVAAILNRNVPETADSAEASRWAAGQEPDRSRGLLCLDALRAVAAKAAIEWLKDEVLTCRYAPFTLFVADARDAFAAYWDDTLRVQELRPGWHVLTHADADDPFDPRAELAHMQLRAAPPRTLEDLVPMLGSHEGGRAICLHADAHGTVSSSLIQCVWADPSATRYLHAAGKPCGTPFQDLSRLATS